VSGQEDRPDEETAIPEVSGQGLQHIRRVGKPVDEKYAPAVFPIITRREKVDVRHEFKGQVGIEDHFPIAVMNIHPGPEHHCSGLFDIVGKRHAVFSGKDGIESRGLEAGRPGGTAGQQASHGKSDQDDRSNVT